MSGFGSWVIGVVGVSSIRTERISSSQGLKCRLLKRERSQPVQLVLLRFVIWSFHLIEFPSQILFFPPLLSSSYP